MAFFGVALSRQRQRPKHGLVSSKRPSRGGRTSDQTGMVRKTVWRGPGTEPSHLCACRDCGSRQRRSERSGCIRRSSAAGSAFARPQGLCVGPHEQTTLVLILCSSFCSKLLQEREIASPAESFQQKQDSWDLSSLTRLDYLSQL